MTLLSECFRGQFYLTSALYSILVMVSSECCIGKQHLIYEHVVGFRAIN